MEVYKSLEQQRQTKLDVTLIKQSQLIICMATLLTQRINKFVFRRT